MCVCERERGGERESEREFVMNPHHMSSDVIMSLCQDFVMHAHHKSSDVNNAASLWSNCYFFFSLSFFFLTQ